MESEAPLEDGDFIGRPPPLDPQHPLNYKSPATFDATSAAAQDASPLMQLTDKINCRVVYCISWLCFVCREVRCVH